MVFNIFHRENDHISSKRVFMQLAQIPNGKYFLSIINLELQYMKIILNFYRKE